MGPSLEPVMEGKHLPSAQHADGIGAEIGIHYPTGIEAILQAAVCCPSMLHATTWIPNYWINICSARLTRRDVRTCAKLYDFPKYLLPNHKNAEGAVRAKR